MAYCVDLVIVLPNYPFYVCSDSLCFSADIDHLYLLIFSSLLRNFSHSWSQKMASSFIGSFHCFIDFNFIYFCSDICSLFLCASCVVLFLYVWCRRINLFPSDCISWYEFPSHCILISCVTLIFLLYYIFISIQFNVFLKKFPFRLPFSWWIKVHHYVPSVFLSFINFYSNSNMGRKLTLYDSLFKTYQDLFYCLGYDLF